jgi:hypothetical protein
MTTVPWPSTVAQFQLWSQVALVWTVASYAFGDDPVGRASLQALTDRLRARWMKTLALRAAFAFVLVLLLPGFSAAQVGSRLLLATSTAGLCALLSWGRLRIATSLRTERLLAEWEVTMALAFIALSGILVAITGLTIERPLLLLPTTPGRITAACTAAAAAVFAVRGGTHFVRGLLDKAGALPSVKAKSTEPASAQATRATVIDISEYNRGRAIGNLERVLMLVLVGVGSYEGLALIIAGKGLIRGKELEDRDFAEYFIIGNLASVAAALAIGIPLRPIVCHLWRL